MKTLFKYFIIVGFCFFITPTCYAGSELNISKINSITGMKGQLQTNNTYKISVPRDDLKMNINGVKLPSAMGLTSWITFKKAGDDTFIQGDLVLTPDQINPILSFALKNGIEVTTLQNHFLWESPQVVFMHVEALGKEGKLASIVNQLFKKINETNDGKGDLPLADMDPSQTNLNTAKLNKLLGGQGILKNGVYKINFYSKKDQEVPHSDIFMNNWAAFVGNNENATVDGNFVVDQSVLQKALRVLNKTGIYVTGIHQNISDSDPNFVFIHYLGVGNTINLAKGIRQVLDLQAEVME